MLIFLLFFPRFILVPEEPSCAEFVRTFVEALFIIHSEANLNSANQWTTISRRIDQPHSTITNPLSSSSRWHDQLIYPLP